MASNKCTNTKNGKNPARSNNKGRMRTAKKDKLSGRPKRKERRQCPHCCGTGKKAGRVEKKRPPPKNMDFPMFFAYVAQRLRNQGTIKSGRVIMKQAGQCWARLSDSQKDHFRTVIMPAIVTKSKANPPPPPPSSSPSPQAPPKDCDNPPPSPQTPPNDSDNPPPSPQTPPKDSDNPPPSPPPNGNDGSGNGYNFHGGSIVAQPLPRAASYSILQPDVPQGFILGRTFP